MNRPDSIRDCLESLKGQTDKDFEVIVVDQSKKRRTKEIVKPYNLKYYRIKKRKNLSVSRNFGINMAAGEVIAFIDDDAQAKEDWIEKIKENFRQGDVQLLSGRVVNKGSLENPVTEFQNGIVSTFGHTQDIRPTDEKIYEKGHAGWYLRAMGTNMAFLKSAVTSIGGFDEFFEYIHDETDLAVRIIKNGGRAIYDDTLMVDHYSASSHNRKSKYKTNWHALAKNNLYFGLKNGNGPMVLRTIRALWRAVGAGGPFLILLRILIHGKIHPFYFLLSEVRSLLGLQQGLRGGLLYKRKLREFSNKPEFLIFTKR